MFREATIADFKQMTQREDVPEYPPTAIREAILNAIVHTEYFIIGSYLQVAIYDDRLEITSPGGLPFGQTLENALTGTSIMRNRMIGRMFRRLNYIEELGSGMRRILEAYRTNKLKPPSFEELGTQFRVILPSRYMPASVQFEWESALLTVLSTRGQMSTKQIAKLWEVTPRTARNRLIELQRQGKLRRIGTSEKDPRAVWLLA